MYALEKTSGSVNWVFSTDDGIERTADDIETTAVILGNSIYITEIKFLLHAIDRSSGEKQWSYRARLPNLSSPVTDGNAIYFSSWTSGGLPGESTQGELAAVSAATGELLWSTDLEIGFSSTPTINNGQVYIGTWDGKFHALNTSNGELVWSYEVGNILPGRAIVKEEKVLFASYYCLEGTFTGTDINNHASTLIALHSQSGEKIWQFSAR